MLVVAIATSYMSWLRAGGTVSFPHLITTLGILVTRMTLSTESGIRGQKGWGERCPRVGQKESLGRRGMGGAGNGNEGNRRGGPGPFSEAMRLVFPRGPWGLWHQGQEFTELGCKCQCEIYLLCLQHSQVHAWGVGWQCHTEYPQFLHLLLSQGSPAQRRAPPAP